MTYELRRDFRIINVPQYVMTPVAEEAEEPLLDQLTAVPKGAYSFRKLRNAYAGSAVRIRASGGAGTNETDIGFDVDGNFDTAAVAAFLVTHGGSAFIVTWYDQIGSENLTQATVASQPLYVIDRAKPIARFDGSNDVLVKTSFALGTNNAVSNFAFIAMTSVGTAISYRSNTAVGSDNDVANFMDIRRTGNNVFGRYTVTNRGTVSTEMAVGRRGLASSIWDGANHTMYMGTLETGTTVATNISSLGNSGTLEIGGDVASSVFHNGDIGEVLLFNEAVAGADLTTIRANIDSYFNPHTNDQIATWNPSDKHASVTLQNDNYDARTVSNSGHRGVRATVSKSSGKWYWEYQIIRAGGWGTPCYFGLSDNTTAAGGQPGAIAKSAGVRGNAAGAVSGGWTLDQAAALGGTDQISTVVGIAVDVTAGKAWIHTNGTYLASGNPAAGTNQWVSGVTGPVFPYASMISSDGVAEVVLRLKTHADNLLYPVPSGFTALG